MNCYRAHDWTNALWVCKCTCGRSITVAPGEIVICPNCQRVLRAVVTLVDPTLKFDITFEREEVQSKMVEMTSLTYPPHTDEATWSWSPKVPKVSENDVFEIHSSVTAEDREGMVSEEVDWDA